MREFCRYVCFAKMERNKSNIQCPNCKTVNPAEAKFCRHCGNALSDISTIEINSNVENAIHNLNEIYKNEKKTYSDKIAEYQKEIDNLQKQLNTTISTKSKEIDSTDMLVIRHKGVLRKKYLFWGYNLILLLIIVFCMGKCNSINNKNNYLTSELEQQENFKSSIAIYKPIEILKIELRSNSSEFGDTLYENKLTKIIPRITVAAMENGNYKLKTKYYKISNWTYEEKRLHLKETYNSPKGISNEEEVDVLESGIKEIQLASFGEDHVGFWDSGRYCIEIWYNDQCLGKKDFSVVERKEPYWRRKIDTEHNLINEKKTISRANKGL